MIRDGEDVEKLEPLLSMVLQVCNPSTEEADAGGSEVQG
jgi:hypothetical protein